MKTITLIALLTMTFSACLPINSNTQDGQKTQSNMKNPFPFDISDIDGHFSIAASIESDTLFKRYYPLFEKYGYSGNGYCWEGHIKQIIEKKDKELLGHIDFDPEAGSFFAYADSKEAQTRFINLLCPIFLDLLQLEEYIKSADRDRIDD